MTTVTSVPTQATYVTKYARSSTHGSLSYLYVHIDPPSDYYQSMTFIRANDEDIPDEDITACRLYLYGTSTLGSQGCSALETDRTWDESTLTYDISDGAGFMKVDWTSRGETDSAFPGSGVYAWRYMDLDVDMANGWKTNNYGVSLWRGPRTTANVPRTAKIYSDEHATTSKRPYFEFDYEGEEEGGAAAPLFFKTI